LRVEGQLRADRGRFVREALARGIEMHRRPVRACDRPIGLGAIFEMVDVAHLQPHRRLAVPAVRLALEEVAEEALLDLHAVVGIEVRPVLEAV